MLAPPYNLNLPFKANEYAVRSNYSAEDGENHSFAGQFNTMLNVKSEDLPFAIKKVAKSVKNANEYEKAHNINSNGKMNIIVQKMINADYSGVIFTANPAAGLLNEIVLVVGEGLGNMVVEDKTDVTTYFYNKDDEIYYMQTVGNSPKIKNKLLNSLFEQAVKIEKIFGFYSDIEFCIKNEEIFILQTRKITTINNDNIIILDSSNISESYPEITLPLSQSFASQVYKHAFTSTVNILSNHNSVVKKLNNVLSNMVACANGRMYYLISNWYYLLQVLPFSGKIIPVWQEMLGVTQKDIKYTNSVKPKIYLKIKIAVNFMCYMIITPNKMKQLDDFFNSIYFNSKQQIENCTNSKQLFEIYENLLQNVGSKWGITLINDMYAFIYTSLAKKKHSEKLNNIHKLESLKPIIEIDKLYVLANKNGINSTEYLNAKEKYLNKYGDRCLQELKLETITMNTDKNMLDNYILNYVPSDIKESFYFENKKEPYVLKCAKKGIFNRELSRMNRTRLYGLARTIFLKIGNNFSIDNIIENERDIFYLYIDEITDCLNSAKSMNHIVKKRKKLYEDYAKLPAFTRLIFSSKIINKTPVNTQNNENCEYASEFIGTASSHGKIKGEVLLIDKPNLNIDTTDKILVTQVTDPGWVFLIQKSKGVITQNGSLLSHTAIITRELKKPSIVGVNNITNALKTGDIIEMDGTTGIINIIKRKQT